MIMRNWKIPETTVAKIGYSGENLVETLTIETDADPKWECYLELSLDGQAFRSSGAFEWQENKLVLPVSEDLLQFSGVFFGQIVGYFDVQVKKSNVFRVLIGDSINATKNIPPVEPSAFEEQEERIRGYVADAQEYATSASESAESAEAARDASVAAKNDAVSAKTAAEAARDAAMSAIPAYTSADNGKFLMIDDGEAAWTAVPQYQGGAY